MTKKIKAAVTGNIGSGKSLFSKYLMELGYIVLNSDDIAKDILANDKDIKKKVIKLFGEGAYKNDKPDTKYLAQNVFSDPAAVQKINALVHPKVISVIMKKLESELKKSNYVFVESALVYEADMESMFDYVVLITADENMRMKRTMQSLKISEEEFRKRENNQIAESEKRKRADFIFENNGSETELKKKAQLLINLLTYSK